MTLAVLWPIMRREFFPEVDAGAFEMYVRALSGTRIEKTEEMIAQVEEFIKKTIPEEDLELYISEIGVNSDWSAAYTPNAGPMDAVIKVQLKPSSGALAQEYVHLIRQGVARGPAVQAPGLRLRRRRPRPWRHERGQIDADQHPDHRQEAGAGPRHRRADPRRGGRRSTAWSTRGSSSGSTTPSTSSTSTAPRPPTSA